MIRVLLADDQALLRTGVRMILENADDILVVGEAGDGAEAAAMAGETAPDVVLMDIRMPDVDGVEATRRIREAGPDGPRILVLTTFDLDEYVYAALRAGASGFILKDTLAADLLSAIRAVARGDAIVAPAVTKRLIERHIGNSGDPLPLSGIELRELTEREREVLELIARGLSNAEIAGRLFLTEGTVKGHVSRVLTKLNLRDRVQAVVFAYECGLVQPGTHSLRSAVANRCPWWGRPASGANADASLAGRQAGGGRLSRRTGSCLPRRARHARLAGPDRSG